MQVFITGGTGYVGSVLVSRLVAAGHEVTALARSQGSAAALAAGGAVPVHGELADVGVLRAAAADADAVVHAAVDYSMTPASQAVELAAVAALAEGAATAGTGTPLIYTSTGLVYGVDPEQDTSEDATLPAASAQPVKAAAERVVLDAPGITPVVVRAGLVYGRGGSGLVTGLIGAAVRDGVATYIEDGANTWRPVHVDDLATLYLAALDRPVPGVYNAVGDSPFSFRELAEAIAELTGTQAVSIPLAVAAQQLGDYAHVLRSTSRLSAEKARATFGWTPAGVPLLDDVRSGSYRVPTTVA